jgi:hypothetical protein
VAAPIHLTDGEIDAAHPRRQTTKEFTTKEFADGSINSGQGVDEAAAIIGGVVERCARESIALKRVSIDPELAEELGLTEGKEIEHGARPTIHCEPRLGRQVRFEKV